MTTILRSAARKLLLTRCAEAGAVAAVGGGAFAAVVAAAWSVAMASPAGATVLCVLPVGAGLAMALWPGLRKAMGVDGGQAAGILVWACILTAAGIVGIWTGAFQGVGRGAVVLAGLVGPGLAGFVLRLRRGVRVGQVAEYLDAKASLRERLATAYELASRPGRRGPLTRAVFAQALDVLRGARPQRAPMWRRTRRTAGALALTVMLGGVVLLTPSPADRLNDRLARAVPGMSLAQRERLAQAFGDRAAMADDPELRSGLLQAAEVVRVRDADELARVLRRLRALGFRPLESVPDDVLLAAGIGAGGVGGQAAGDANRAVDPNRAGGPDVDANTVAEEDGYAGGVVHVYNPGYVGASDANAEGRRAALSPAPYGDAWSAARERAATSLARGAVPARYRGVVRAYFLADD